MKHEWLSDQTKLVSSAMETEQLAEKVGWLFFCSTQKRLEVDETRETNGPPSISLFLSLSLCVYVCSTDVVGWSVRTGWVAWHCFSPLLALVQVQGSKYFRLRARR